MKDNTRNRSKAYPGKQPPQRFGFGINSPTILQPYAHVGIPAVMAAMPSPLVLGDADRRMVSRIESEVLQTFGVKKGNYADRKSVKDYLYPVHDRLLEEMRRRIIRLDQKELVLRLYDQLERLYAYLNVAQARLEVQALVNGDKNAPMASFSQHIALTPQIVGIKYLLEIVVQDGQNTPESPDRGSLKELIALASRFVELDGFMEAVYHGLDLYEVEITDEHKIMIRTSPHGRRARERWLEACQTHIFAGARSRARDRDKAATQKISKEEIIDRPDIGTLNKAMREELGYGLAELMDVAAATIKLIDEKQQWIIAIPKLKFIRYLKLTTGLPLDVLESIVADRTMQKIGDDATHASEEIYPIQHYWRHSRLVNRPFIELEGTEGSVVILGVEVATAAFSVRLEREINGHERIPGSALGGPIEKIIGTFQEKAGNPFRDEMAAACIEMGFVATTEELPPGVSKSAIGPVDVFVIDEKHKRFLIVECKALDIARTPREMVDQRKRFFGATTREQSRKRPFLETLQIKHAAFESKAGELMRKYRIKSSEPFRVESVIVMGHPMEWVYLEPAGTPILDDNEFFDRLKSGRPMVQ